MSRTVLVACVLALVVLSVLPVARTASSSFVVDGGFGLDHYHEAFVGADPGEAAAVSGASAASRWQLLGNSVAIAALAALLALLIGVPYAVLTARTDVPFGRVLSWAYLAPLVLPPLLVGVAWTYAFEPAPKVSVQGDSIWGGPIAVLRAAGLFALCYFPLVVLFARRALQRIPASLEESARLAGGPWSALTRVTLPLAAPGTLAGALFVFLFSLNDFSVVDFLNWVRPTADQIRVYPLASFQAWDKPGGEGFASALGVPLAVVGVVMLLGIHSLVGRRHGAAVAGSFRPPAIWSLGTWRWPSFAGAIALLVVSAVVPVAGLLIEAGGLRSYQAVWQVVAGPTSGTNEVAWTLWLAGGAAVLSLPLAFVLAHRVARRRSTWISVLALLPLALPPIFLGVGYLRVFGHEAMTLPLPGAVDGRNPFLDLDGPRFGPMLLLLAKYLPFALAALWAAFLEIDPRLEEAAASAGAGPLDRVLGVLLPLVKPALALAAVLVFVFALREIDTVVLLEPRSIMRKIYNMVHYQRDAQVAALCVILMGLQALAFVVFAVLFPRTAKAVRAA